MALIVANRTKELKPEQQEETIKLNKLDEEFLTKFTTIVEENIDMEKMDMSFMMEKMNKAESRQSTMSTLHTIHNSMPPHR